MTRDIETGQQSTQSLLKQKRGPEVQLEEVYKRYETGNLSQRPKAQGGAKTGSRNVFAESESDEERKVSVQRWESINTNRSRSRSRVRYQQKLRSSQNLSGKASAPRREREESPEVRKKKTRGRMRSSLEDKFDNVVDFREFSRRSNSCKKRASKGFVESAYSDISGKSMPKSLRTSAKHSFIKSNYFSRDESAEPEEKSKDKPDGGRKRKIGKKRRKRKKKGSKKKAKRPKGAKKGASKPKAKVRAEDIEHMRVEKAGQAPRRKARTRRDKRRFYSRRSHSVKRRAETGITEVCEAAQKARPQNGRPKGMQYQYMTYDPRRREETVWESGRNEGILKRPRKLETVDGFRDRSPLKMDFSGQLGKIKRGIWEKRGIDYVRITDQLEAENIRRVRGYHSVEMIERRSRERASGEEGVEDEVERRLRQYRKGEIELIRLRVAEQAKEVGEGEKRGAEERGTETSEDGTAREGAYREIEEIRVEGEEAPEREKGRDARQEAKREDEEEAQKEGTREAAPETQEEAEEDEITNLKNKIQELGEMGGRKKETRARSRNQKRARRDEEWLEEGRVMTLRDLKRMKKLRTKSSPVEGAPRAETQEGLSISNILSNQEERDKVGKRMIIDDISEHVDVQVKKASFGIGRRNFKRSKQVKEKKEFNISMEKIFEENSNRKIELQGKIFAEESFQVENEESSRKIGEVLFSRVNLESDDGRRPEAGRRVPVMHQSEFWDAEEEQGPVEQEGMRQEDMGQSEGVGLEERGEEETVREQAHWSETQSQDRQDGTGETEHEHSDVYMHYDEADDGGDGDGGSADHNPKYHVESELIEPKHVEDFMAQEEQESLGDGHVEQEQARDTGEEPEHAEEPREGESERAPSGDGAERPQKKDYFEDFEDMSATFDDEDERRDFEQNGFERKSPSSGKKHILSELNAKRMQMSEIAPVQLEESEVGVQELRATVEGFQDEGADQIKRRILEIAKEAEAERGNEDVTSEMRSRMYESTRSRRKKFDLSRRTGESERDSVFSMRSQRNRSEKSSLLERIEKSVRWD